MPYSLTMQTIVLAALFLLTGSLSAADQPNVLWLTAEDHGPHVGAYGDPYASTPVIDKLAARGMLYRHAWSTAPVAPLEWQSGDPDTRVVVVSHPQVNIQQLIDLLRAVGTRIPGASYMLAIADDIARPSGGEQPWPPA